MKQKLFWTIGVILFFSQVHGQSISPFLFGQNSWMPYAYGTDIYYGQLNQLWTKVKDSKVKLIRIGGIGPDFNRPTNDQYISLIDSIRKIGAEPLVQVPYGRAAYTATDAVDIVTYINVTMGRDIKYWSISNEPNLATHGYSAVPVATVESYIKSFATAMKSVDPSILIAGPECAWYDAAYYNNLIGGSNDITGKDANGRYYIDIVSFHSYPFGGTQSRSDVVNYPSGGLSGIIASLLSNISSANTKNGRTGSDALMWAITEFNVNYQNPSSNTINGVGVESFLNGQFWAEYFGEGMANDAFAMLPWSIHESSGNRTSYDLGYLDNNTTFLPRPCYYHESMMAENFNGSFISSVDNQSLIKTFASENTEQVTVMILNQDQTNGYDFTLRLDNSTATGSTLTINVNAGISAGLSDSIPSQSSWILVFDKNGNLNKKCIYSLDMATASEGPACYTQSPYSIYFDLPAIIQAEEFDKGGQNIAYYDLTSGNSGSQFRSEEVDIETCQDTGGGYDVTGIEAGEWLEYTINSTVSIIYDIDFRVASVNGNGAFHLELDGSALTSSIMVESTGGGQNWTTLSQKSISIPSGQHILRIYIESGNFNLNSIAFNEATLGVVNPFIQNDNLLSFSVRPNPATEKLELLFDTNSSSDLFVIITDASGNEMFFRSYYSLSGKLQETINVSDWNSGLYLIYLNSEGQKYSQKIIVE